MIPRHVAIIMDGNGRWAQLRKRPRTFGHQAGVKATRRVVENCAKAGIEVLTLFAFSSENWQRPANEVNRLMELFMRALHKEVDVLEENNISLSFIGDHTALSTELQDRMTVVQERTADNDGLRLVIAMNYGGRWDIVEACRNIARDVRDQVIDAEQIDEHLMNRYCQLGEFVNLDLIIRTGGEKRVSNFLLWQLAYSELFFTDTLWPDFNQTDLDAALESYANRQRRYGCTDQQVVARNA